MTRVRYLVVSVSLLMAVLLYLDRFCISFASDYIREDLQLTQTQIAGMISIFFWSYALAQVPSGWLSDRYGSRIMLSLYIILWSVFTLLTGVVSGLIGLLIIRAGCGLGQAGAYPTSASVISKWIPLSGRAAASSIVALGGRCGGALAPLLTAFLMVLFVPISSDGIGDRLAPRDILHSGRLCHHLAPPAPDSAADTSSPTPTAAARAPAHRVWTWVNSQLSTSERQAVLTVASQYRELLASRELQTKADEPVTADPSIVTLDSDTTTALLDALNLVLDDRSFYDQPTHVAVNLPRQAEDLQSRQQAGELLSLPELRRL
ncbi:MAG: MFS transporter, partial [Planctomycetaceae bacterium]